MWEEIYKNLVSRGYDPETAKEIADWIHGKIEKYSEKLSPRERGGLVSQLDAVVSGLIPVYDLVTGKRVPRNSELNKWSFKICGEELEKLRNPVELFKIIEKKIPGISDKREEFFREYAKLKESVKPSSVKTRTLMAYVLWKMGYKQVLAASLLGVSDISLRKLGKRVARVKVPVTG